MNSSLTGKNIVIGLTGSIACYKIGELIRLFIKSGANVKTVVSDAALEFIGEKTLETLSSNPVYNDMFQKRDSTKHISLADWADLFILAPASANTISKAALGIADNLLTSIFCAYLGSKKPFIIAPAMNTGMWNNPFVKENIKKLKSLNCIITGPVEGSLACGYDGEGKMEEPVRIFECAKNALLIKKNKKVIITAGGTKEAIDAVRYITNASSGKMGIALADAAYDMGYDVELVCSFDVKNKPYDTFTVSNTLNMFNAVQERFQNADYLIMAAAVSDYRVKNPSENKLSKEYNKTLNIELVQNPDILKSISSKNTNGKKIIGFSLTTNDTLETAGQKLKAKNLDFIIANEAKTALNTDETEVWVINRNLEIRHIEKDKKENVAYKILELVL